MKLKLCTALLTAATIFAPLSLTAEKAQDRADAKRVAVESYGRLPLSFEPTESASTFLAHSGNYAVSVGARESSVAVSNAKSGKTRTLRFAFDNANVASSIEAIEPQPGVTNYYRGQDARKWRLGVKNYAKLRAEGVYPGVDVVYYGDHRRLEFDFVVAPKADPSAIALSFSGMDNFYKDASGDLVAEVGGQPVRFAKPYAYQKVDGAAKPVAADYELASNGKVHLLLGAYDRSRELIVDPVVKFATYLGGSNGDVANGIAVDDQGSAYVTGQTCSSTDFPKTTVASPNPSGYVFEGACDAYVTKFAPDGTALVYTTILGGSTPANAAATGYGIALDSQKQAYVVGATNLSDLPGNVGGALNVYQGGDSDAFIVILNASGTLQRSSYLGGRSADAGYGIAVDQATPANVIVVGQTCSQDFPGYRAFETKVEACVAFVTKLDNNLDIASPISSTASALSDAPPSGGGKTYYFSEFFGGQPVAPFPSAGAWAPFTPYTKGAIVLDNQDPSHIEIALNDGTSGPYTPATTTITLPIPKWNTSPQGITLEGSMSWENYGPSSAPVTAFTEAYGVALDSPGDIFLVGGTNTTSLSSTLWPCSTAGRGAWILKVSGKTGGCIYAWGLEATPTDVTGTFDTARAVAVDSQGQAYVTGTMGTDSGADAFLARVNFLGSAIDYSTHLGGSGKDQGLGVAVDGSFQAYVTGITESMDFPVINSIQNPNTLSDLPLSGTQGAFITKFTLDGSALIFSSYLGGSQTDRGNAIAVDPTNLGNMYIAGTTTSPDLETSLLLQPMVSSSYAPPQTALNGDPLGRDGASDAFVAMIPGAGIPTVTVSPGSLTFPTQDVGTTSTYIPVVFTIQGISTVNISSIQFSNSQFTQLFRQLTGNDADCFEGPITPIVVKPFVTGCTIWVVFTPTAQNRQTGSLIIKDGSSSKSHVINLSGTGAVPGYIATPSNLTFLDQGVNTPSTAQPVILKNAGLGTLLISGLNTTGDFHLDNPVAPLDPTDPTPPSPITTCESELAPGSNCILGVIFKPSGTGLRTGILTVTDNAPGSPHQIGLKGNGVRVNNTISPSSLSFAPQAMNAPSKAQTITVTNTDPAQTLKITAVGISGDYQISSDGCTGQNLAHAIPFPTCTVQVVFSPTAAGTRTGTLSFTSNGQTPTTVALSGTAGATMKLSDPPNPPTLANTNLGGTNYQKFTLFNTSPVSFNVLGIAVSGAAAGDFSQTNDCGTSVLASPAVCTITVAFKPSATGNRNATLTVTSDAANSPLSVALAGVGQQPIATVLPTLTFSAGQALNVPTATLPITLTNTADPTWQFAGTLNIPAGGVSITGAAASDFTQTNNCNSIPVAPGAFCTITVSFTPSALGSRTASLVITDDAIPGTQTVALSGTGVLVQAPTVTPTNPLSFQNKLVGSLNTGTITIANNDPAQKLLVSAATITGDYQIVTNNCLVAGPVAAGSSCTLVVSFTPTTTGVRTGSLTLSGNAVGMPSATTITGTAGATMQLSTPTFANTNLGGTNIKAVTLTNASVPGSTAVINIQQIAVSGPAGGDFTLSNDCGTSVKAAPAVCTITVAFNPSATGNRNATLTVTTDAANSPLSVALAGVGMQPIASVLPTLTFATGQALNVPTATLPITLTNTATGQFAGNLNIPAGGISISGAAASDFTQTNNCVQVAPGAFCTINVTFTPSALLSRTASLVIADDAIPGTQTVALSGTGVLVQAPTVTSTQPSFPNVQVNVSVDGIVTVQNNDPVQRLLVSSASITGDFRIKTNNCIAAGSVAPNSSCTLVVTFTPTATGPRTGTLTLSGNAVGMPSATVITGTAGAKMTLPTPQTFANTNLGGTNYQAVRLTNTSTVSFNVLGITVSGAAASDFIQTNDCGTSVLPAPSFCTITVAFKPSAMGNRNATLTVTTDANSPQPVALFGVGTAPVVTLTAPGYVFGNQPGSQPLTFAPQPLNAASSAITITLTNTGNGPLNIPAGGITITGTAAGDFSQSYTCGTQVPINATCTIKVIFTPSALSNRSATLNIVNDAITSPQNVAMFGIGLPFAPPTITPASLTFSNQSLNQVSAKQTVTITNHEAGAPLSLSAAVATGDFQVVAGGCGASLASSASCGIGVTFTPTASGIRSGTLTIPTNGSSTPLTVSLTGKGGAVATISPTSRNLGSANVGTSSASQVVTLDNSTSSFPVNITGVTLSGTAASEFVVANNCGTIVPALSTCTMGVIFNPTATGIQTATMTVSSDSFLPFSPVSLTGNGTSPVVSLSTLNLGFPSQVLNVASAAKKVTLINTGTGPLNFSSPIAITGAAPGDFTQTNNCGLQVVSLGTCDINVIFTPTALNSRTANLVLTDDATASSPQTVALSGAGIAGSGTIVLSSPNLSFGNQQVNTTSAAQTVTLRNSSTTSPLSITGITITGTGNSDFAIATNNCPASLAVAASCSITVAFTPSVTIAETATLTVSGSATNSPQLVTLTGTGTPVGSGAAGPFTVTPGEPEGVSITQGGTAVYSFAVAPQNGFNSSITFTCSGPKGSSCSVTPNPLVMDGRTVPTVKLFVSTTGGNGITANLQSGAKSIIFALLPFTMMGMLLTGKRRGVRLLLALLLVCLAFGMVGCGASNSATATTSGLAPGSYQVSVTAASGSATQTIALNLVVNKQ